MTPAGDSAWTSQEEFEKHSGLSHGAVVHGIKSGDLVAKYVGRRVFVSRAAWNLAALGITGPEDLGAFVRGAGIRNLAGLLEFLGAGSDPERNPTTCRCHSTTGDTA